MAIGLVRIDSNEDTQSHLDILQGTHEDCILRIIQTVPFPVRANAGTMGQCALFSKLESVGTKKEGHAGG